MSAITHLAEPCEILRFLDITIANITQYLRKGTYFL